ncbi:hypothetical protein IAU59_005538 [Kwoniella sp. CBS 9459]
MSEHMTRREIIRKDAAPSLTATYATLDGLAQSLGRSDRALNQHRLPNGISLAGYTDETVRKLGLSKEAVLKHVATDTYASLLRDNIESSVFVTPPATDGESKVWKIDVPDTVCDQFEGGVEGFADQVYEGLKDHAISPGAVAGPCSLQDQTILTIAGRVILRHPLIHHDEAVSGLDFLSCLSDIGDGDNRKAFRVCSDLTGRGEYRKQRIDQKQVTASQNRSIVQSVERPSIRVTQTDLENAAAERSNQSTTEESRAVARSKAHPEWPVDLRSFVFSHGPGGSSGKEYPTADQIEAGRLPGRNNRDVALHDLYTSVTEGRSEQDATDTWNETNLAPTFIGDETAEDQFLFRSYASQLPITLESFLPKASILSSALDDMSKSTGAGGDATTSMTALSLQERSTS